MRSRQTGARFPPRKRRLNRDVEGRVSAYVALRPVKPRIFASSFAMTYKAEWKHTEPLSPFPMMEAAERQIMIAIEARDITKSFGSAQVLKGVSLAAEQGDVISIIGASGSGKSTFLRCLNLLEVPDRGEVIADEEHLTIGEAPLDRRQVERIRRRVAMVFQSFNLWHHMTVLGNVIEAPVH